jgi:putative nucleotidyltransferase with HDIG domain
LDRKATILNKVRTVPAIPATASQVLQLIHNPDFVIEELIHLIEHDQVATANILRLANSAYFGRGTAIDSIREAIVRMGAQRIGQLLTVASVGPFAIRPLKGYDLPPGELWRHSVAVAITTDLLAKHLKLRMTGSAFTAGLLHDLGKVVLDVFIEADATTVKGLVYQENVSFVMAERQVLGIDHTEVGAELLQVWNIPRHLIDAVRWHHAPDAAPEISMACDLVHMADFVVFQNGIGVGIDGLSYGLSPKVKQRLQSAEDLMPEISEKLQEELESIEELFRMAK